MGFIQRFMQGRNGTDALSIFLLILYVAINLVANLLDSFMLSSLSMVLAFICIYRMLSHRVDKRRAENAQFMELAKPAMQWWRLYRAKRKDKDHCYFKCPKCAQQLRVPKGKGKVTINCRNCGVSFQEKT